MRKRTKEARKKREMQGDAGGSRDRTQRKAQGEGCAVCDIIGNERARTALRPKTTDGKNDFKLSIDTATGAEAPPEISSERVKDIFSSIAHKYERFNALSSFGAYRSWLRSMVREAPIGPDDTVLDIAGGTGDVTFAVAREKRPARIVCTDLVPEMLEIAHEHDASGASCGIPVEFAVVDAQDIPYPDENFDAVTIAYGIRNMPEREKALSEMHRVLRPGGSFTCLEFSTPPNPLWRALYRFYLRFCIPFWGQVVTGDRSGFIYLAQSIRAFPDQEAFAHMLTRAGFANVSWKNCTGGIAVVHTATKPQ